MQWRIVPVSGEIVGIVAVVSGVGVVRGHINRERVDRHRRRKVRLLPSRCSLVREGGRRQQRARARPEIPHVGACVGK